MPGYVNYEQIRDGLFLAPSRTYGESYIEPLVRHLYGLLEADNNSHDAKDATGKRFEIKASKVLKSLGDLRNESLIEQIIAQTERTEIHRLVPFCEATSAIYDANIQNVKRDDFDELIYVLLFEDVMKIFAIESQDINSDNVPGWSDRHGRYDAVGKSGQFNINKDRIEYHVVNFLQDTLTYEEAAEIYEELS